MKKIICALSLHMFCIFAAQPPLLPLLRRPPATTIASEREMPLNNVANGTIYAFFSTEPFLQSLKALPQPIMYSSNAKFNALLGEIHAAFSQPELQKIYSFFKQFIDNLYDTIRKKDVIASQEARVVDAFLESITPRFHINYTMNPIEMPLRLFENPQALTQEQITALRNGHLSFKKLFPTFQDAVKHLPPMKMIDSPFYIIHLQNYISCTVDVPTHPTIEIAIHALRERGYTVNETGFTYVEHLQLPTNSIDIPLSMNLNSHNYELMAALVRNQEFGSPHAIIKRYNWWIECNDRISSTDPNPSVIINPQYNFLHEIIDSFPRERSASSRYNTRPIVLFYKKAGPDDRVPPVLSDTQASDAADNFDTELKQFARSLEKIQHKVRHTGRSRRGRT